RIGLGRDADFHGGAHIAVDPGEYRPAELERRAHLVRLGPDGQVGRGPQPIVFDVADIYEAAPAVAHGVFPPARHGDVAEAAEAAPRRRHDGREIAVRPYADFRRS